MGMMDYPEKENWQGKYKACYKLEKGSYFLLINGGIKWITI